MRRLIIATVGVGGVLAIHSVFALWTHRAIVVPVVTVAVVLVAMFASTSDSTREAWTDKYAVLLGDSAAAGHASRSADGRTYQIRLTRAAAHSAAETQ